MKKLLTFTALLAALACQAAEIDTAAPVGSAPQGRCPPPRVAKLVQMPEGEFTFVVRYLVKADGSIENVRVNGGKASRDTKRAVRDAFDGLRCQPADADHEYETSLRVDTKVH